MLATKAAAIISKITTKLVRGEMPPSNIPAYNMGMTITKG